MNIERLEIKGFGKLKELSIPFSPGLNIVYGSNEAGKSTLLWFIKGMLYGLKGGRSSPEGIAPPLKRYRPWLGDQFGGFMEYGLESGELFRVERNFSPSSVKVYKSNFQEVTGSFEFSKENGPLFAEKHLGLNEACFDRTVLVSQMESRVDFNGRQELLNRLINTAQTGFDDISFKRAQEALKDAMKSRIGTDRTTTGPLNKAASRLSQLKSLRPQIAEEKNKMAQVEGELRSLRESRTRLEDLSAALHKAKDITGLRMSADKARIMRSGLAGHLDTLEALEILESKKVEEPAKDKILRAESRMRLFNISLAALGVLFGISTAAAFVLPSFRPSGLVASALALAAAAVLFIFRAAATRTLSGLKKTRTVRQVSANNSKAQQIAALKDNINLTKAEIAVLDNSLEVSLSELEVLCGQIGPAEHSYEDIFQNIIINDPVNLSEAISGSIGTVDAELKRVLVKISENETRLSLSDKEDDRLQALDEEVAEIEARMASLEDAGKSLSLAFEILTEASLEIQRDFAPALNQRMGGIIRKITNNRYTDLRADNRLSLNALSPETGGVTSVLQLSSGTTDQMYLALRLAAAGLITSGGEKPPLLLDEIFAQYDDIRTKETLEFLKELSVEYQVILFTCKKREVDMSREISGPVNIIELD